MAESYVYLEMSVKRMGSSLNRGSWSPARKLGRGINYIGQGVHMIGLVPNHYDRFGYDLSRSLGQDWRVSA